MVWLLTLFACSLAEEWCLDAGLGAETCSDPSVPVEGEWTLLVSRDAPLPDCDVRPIDIDDGWTLAPAGAAFTLAPPVDATPLVPADCTLEAETFSCAPAAGPSGTELVVSGTLASRSEGTMMLDLSSPTCDAQVEARFVASWTLAPPVKECPDIGDDSFEVDRSIAEVGVTVVNASTENLSLFLLGGGGPVLSSEMASGATVTTAARPGNWMMLATGFEQENCVFAFEVVEDGQQAIYWGP